MKNSECWYSEVCGRYREGCEHMCIRYTEMKYLMDNSGVSKNNQIPAVLKPDAVDLPAFKRLAEIKSNIVEFVDEGRSLYITSDHVGNGKTSWALKLLLKYFDEVWAGNGCRVRGVFVRVPTFLAKCKEFKTVDPQFEELKNNLMTVDLVVWDDIASTDVSSYDIGQLTRFIDTRVGDGLSNIYTGNIPRRDELEKFLGVRLTSRIMTSGTEIIEFKGGDRR